MCDRPLEARHELHATPLEIRGPKSAWVDQVFDHIGQSEVDWNYMAASAGDIWGFLDDVTRWAADPGRRGLG